MKALIGGTHLTGRKSAYTIATIEGLRKYGLGILSPCHCTGFEAMAELFHAFPESARAHTIEPLKIIRERMLKL